MTDLQIASFDTHTTLALLTQTGSRWRDGDGAGGNIGAVLDPDGYFDSCIRSGDVRCYVSQLLTGLTSLRLGFHVMFDSVAADGDKPFFQLLDSAGANLVTLHRNAGTVKQTRNGGTDQSGTVLAADTWHWVEVRCVIGDAGGVVETRVDLATAATFSGDTKPGAATQTGEVRLLGDGATDNDLNTRIDNWVLTDDTAYPGVRVNERLGPAGNGNSSQWLGSDADSIDNYALINEQATDDLTWVESAVDGDKDTYAFDDPTRFSGGTPISLQVGARARWTTSAKELAFVTRVSTTEEDSTDVAVTSAFADHYRMFPTQPGGAAWSYDALDSMEVGQKQRPV